MKQHALIIFGAGKVGRALVRQLREADEYHLARHGVRFSVTAWCDREGALVDERGILPGVLDRASDAKAAGAPFAELEEGYRQNSLTGIVDVAGREDTILVDVSATDATVPALEMGLSRGYAAATANKVPLTLGQDVFDRLTAGGRFRYESTVGSAVPVIGAALGLVAAADRVSSVQGALSGTLGFLCTGLQAGQPCSGLVREAMARGYTEPDPRIDLGGVDVARKALIIARTLGWRMELADIRVESLVPAPLARLGLEEFLARLPELDTEYARQVDVAGTEGKVLRYVAELRDSAASVGMQAVPITTALGRLQGNDNLVAFSTRYYPDTPLVLQGRGAGVEAAAAGVHADIVALASSAGRGE
jgi:homoserine dehydrogenase